MNDDKKLIDIDDEAFFEDLDVIHEEALKYARVRAAILGDEK